MSDTGGFYHTATRRDPTNDRPIELPLQTGKHLRRRGPREKPFGQLSLVVPAGRRPVVGHRRVQGHAAHRESRRVGQADQSRLDVGVQFVGRRHVGDFLSDQSLLASARVARRRRFLLVRGQDNRRHLQVFVVLFGQNGLQSEPDRGQRQKIQRHQRGTVTKYTLSCRTRCSAGAPFSLFLLKKNYATRPFLF